MRVFDSQPGGVRVITAHSTIAKGFTVLLLVGLGVCSASITYAIGGGPWFSSSNPLQVSTKGQVNGQAYGTFAGYQEDSSKGSILMNYSYHRASGSSFGFKNGAYVSNTWWSNGQSCYVSSFDISTGAAGINCGAGWNRRAEGQTSRNKSTTSWSNRWNNSWNIDPTGSSGRVGVRVCLDWSLASDPCSGYVYRGADY